jgi:hypothetical protein
MIKYRYIESIRTSVKFVIGCKIAPNFDGVPGAYNLPKYVIRRLSNSVKISFEYHTVFRAVKY